jgi:hypothetical protein
LLAIKNSVIFACFRKLAVHYWIHMFRSKHIRQQLWDVHSFSFNYLKNCKIYRKSLPNIKCVLHLSLYLFEKHFSLQHSFIKLHSRRYKKCMCLPVCHHHFCPFLTKIGIYRQNFSKAFCIKFYGNLFSDSLYIACGPLDRLVKLAGKFLQIFVVNVPKH